MTGKAMKLALAAGIVACAGAAFAQATLKPGLWEVQMNSPEMDKMRKDMQAEFAKMPPAERAQMEKMMAGRGMTPGGPMRLCFTEEALRNRGPVREEEGCTVKTSARGALNVVDMQCRDGRTGHGEFTYASESYKGFFEASDPKQGRTRMEQSGKWLGADCGNVKPIRPPSGAAAGRKG